MKPSTELTQARLMEVLKYDRHTGLFKWKVTLSRRVSVGDEAGHKDPESGYNTIRLDGILYQAHRLAWLFETGSWPTALLDHIDGDRLNNRLSNLREATRTENNRNTKKRKGCSSKFKGVCLDRRDMRWQAYINSNGKRTSLGCYGTEEEAHAAYCKAAKELHGEFANYGTV